MVVQQPGDAAAESGPLRDSREAREQGRSEGSVGKEGALVALGSKGGGQPPQSREATIGATFVVGNHSPDGWLAGEKGCGAGSHDHIHRTESAGELLDQWEGEDDVAEEGGLDY
jgi:hypothetical protein